MRIIPSQALRRFIAVTLIAALAVGSGYLGARVGILYRTNRLLFELSKKESLRQAVRLALGIQKHFAAAEQDLWVAFCVAPGKRDGYYVDVGSSDGVIHSNSNLFDQMGWKGICIDPFPSGMEHRTCQMFRQPVFSES